MNIVAFQKHRIVKHPVIRFILLFCIGLTTRLVILNIGHGWYRSLVDYEPQRIARSLAEGNGFSNPFLLTTGPSAHLAPGFASLLAVIYRFAGDGITGQLISDTMNSAVSATVGALLPVAAALSGVHPAVGFLAGLLYAVLPLQPYTESRGDWEAPIGALLLISIFILVRRNIQLSDLRYGCPVVLGILTGLTGLFIPTLLPVAICFLAVLYYQQPRSKTVLRYCAIVLLITIACIGPWIIRNRVSMGHWVPLRDDLGLELRLAYSDNARPTTAENIAAGHHQEIHPNMSADQSIRVRELGEVEFNRHQFALALDWIRKHPNQFVSYTLKHFQLFWTFRSRFVPLLPLAFIGLYVLRNRDRPSFYLITSVWMLYPIIYYFVPFAPRYRHPIEWTVVVAAAIAAQTIFDKAIRKLQSKHREQLVLATQALMAPPATAV